MEESGSSNNFVPAARWINPVDPPPSPPSIPHVPDSLKGTERHVSLFLRSFSLPLLLLLLLFLIINKTNMCESGGRSRVETQDPAVSGLLISIMWEKLQTGRSTPSTSSALCAGSSLLQFSFTLNENQGSFKLLRVSVRPPRDHEGSEENLHLKTSQLSPCAGGAPASLVYYSGIKEPSVQPSASPPSSSCTSSPPHHCDGQEAGGRERKHTEYAGRRKRRGPEERRRETGIPV
ncbi:unnamed protein product [Pleuronectes platessa]|uniref:Uncharacterized protein n=1 Tax=Pleuronectes platessa TaxID=8262 RepID=A0A9N7UPI1_PLEPL|nr:unnamed protein product [Pleuronectes platessa]